MYDPTQWGKGTWFGCLVWTIGCVLLILFFYLWRFPAREGRLRYAKVIERQQLEDELLRAKIEYFKQGENYNEMKRSKPERLRATCKECEKK